jgi:molybdenum cofactor cytidylyltransferase
VPGITAILLAAGESSRMGQPKPLLPWGGLPLIQYQIASLSEASASPIVVVLGHNSEDIAPYVENSPTLQTVINPDYAEGKTTSIRLGVSQVLDDVDGILLLAVDQPRPADLVRRVIEEHLRSGALITHPTYNGRGGHPIIFAGSLKSELLAITEEQQGIREVVGRHQDSIRTVAVESPIARVDLNTMGDYESALREFGSHS